MSTKAQPQQQKPARSNHPLYINDGLTPKKTALIIVTVIGCIAILWPKVFHPMLFGQPPQKAAFKDHRGAGGGLRQERPAHLHPESIYQAMKERGRAIPPTQTVPIVERKTSASNPPPRIVEGRPGPIPGMRPPMGAGALHQPQQKGNSMGFIMPLYTIGIIVFFGYTIMKLVFKKPIPNAPYGPAPTDPNFRKEVFGQENGRHVEELNGSKLVVTAIQGLIDAADEELNLRENKTTSEENKKQSENSTLNNVDNISSEHTTTSSNKSDEHNDLPNDDKNSSEALKTESKVEEIKENGTSTGLDKTSTEKAKHTDVDRSVTVVGLEITASCEGGKKWTGRPPTSAFISHNEHSKNEEDFPEPQSIYLEGSLPHESKILVSDAEIKKEEIYDAELNGSAEEPAVVLSSKMTLSLINLDANNENLTPDVESPLADDIEIIGHEEQEIDSN